MANPTLTGPNTAQGTDIEIKAADGASIKAYQSRPQGVEPSAGVIVIHENRGLVPYLRDVADGLASSGYLAVAPDLLSREGGTDKLAASGKEIPGVLGDIPRERFVDDVLTVAGYLRNQAAVQKVGILGFCFGGGIVWRYATADKDLAAAIPFYGANPPLDAVPDINAAVFGIYGELDERINQGIDAITEAMKNAGKPFELKVYPQAGHAFHNHTNPPDRYNAQAAQQAWTDALSWLEKHLK